MAEVIHRYVGRDGAVPERKQSKSEQEREKLDAAWKQARIDAELARQKVHAAKLPEMKGELISRRHVQKQAAFLVLSLLARLLALSGQHAGALLNVSDEREMSRRLDALIRVALDEMAELPLKVSDPDWMMRLDDEVEQPSKRSKRVAK
jgi:hypothetical protein